MNTNTISNAASTTTNKSDAKTPDVKAPDAKPSQAKQQQPDAPKDILAELKAQAGAPTSSGRKGKSGSDQRIYLRNGMVHLCHGKFCLGRQATLSKADHKEHTGRVVEELKHEGKVVGAVVALSGGISEQWILLERQSLAPAV